MADLLQETEAIPASYPVPPSGLSPPAAALEAAMIWQRIEAYRRTRYTARAITWIIQARAGEHWTPPLVPVAAHTAEKWHAGAWNPIKFHDGPTGLCTASEGVFRITARIGGGDPPPAVAEAFRRLAEYMADDTDRAGVHSYSVNLGGAIQESYHRRAA